MTVELMIARQRELTEAARRESRNLTADEQREFDQLQGQIEAAQRAQGAGNGAEPQADGQSRAAGTGTEPQAAGRNAEPQNGAPNAGNTGREPDAGIRAAAQQAMQEERTRISQITDLCRSFSIDPQTYIRDGLSIDAVREAVIRHLQETGSPIGTRVTQDSEDKRRAAIADGMLMRENIHVEHPAAGASEFRGASLWQIAAACLQADGHEQRNYQMMGPAELFGEVMQRAYYNPTASFPAIMDNVVDKAYKEGHRTAPVTFDQFTSRGTLRDFKKADNYYLRGSFGEFLEVPEGGELKHTLPVDEKLPQRQLKTYGRQFTMSRQAFINDDMGVVTAMPMQAAKAARTTINTQVYRILVDNPKAYDGKALFGAEHKNLLKTGSGITQEAVQAMILALGSHTRKADGIDQAILIRPAVLVVPLGYKFAMYTLFNSQTVSASGDVNPLYQYRDAIRIVEDATLNVLAGAGAIPWFMVGDLNDTDFIQIDYLNGQAIPNIRRMEKAGQLGFTWDVFGDWGITIMDPWGAVKNPGIAVKSPLELA